MTEELTVSVRQQVELYLKQSLINFQHSADFAVESMPELRDFYERSVSELAKVVDGYKSGGEKVESAPAEIPVKIGDRVRVLPGCGSAPAGLEFKVKRVTRNKSPYDDGVNWYVEGTKKGSTNGVWGKFIEVIEPKSDASKIEAGDLVRLTGEYWDEHKGDIYTITRIDPDGDPTFHDTDGTEWYVTGEGYAAEVYKKASEL